MTRDDGRGGLTAAESARGSSKSSCRRLEQPGSGQIVGVSMSSKAVQGPVAARTGVEGSPSQRSSRASTKKEIALTVNRWPEPHCEYRMRSGGGGSRGNVFRGRRTDRRPLGSLLRAHRRQQAERDVGDDGGERKVAVADSGGRRDGLE